MSRRASQLVLLAVIVLAAGCNNDKSTAPSTTKFHATLSGANEAPANSSSGTGTADVTINGNTLTYTVSWSGLSSATFAAHFHSGTATTSGGLVVFPFTNLGTATSGTTSGTIDLTLANINPSNASGISGDSLRKLFLAGNIYTNVHSTNFKGGEIRGQMQQQ